MLKLFMVEAVLAGGLGIVFLASTVADNWVPALVVIGAGSVSAVSSVVMANVNNRAAERRAAQAAAIAAEVKKEDYRRLDEVASRAELVGEKVSATADNLITHNKAVAEKVTEAADLAATAAETLAVSNEVVATKVSEVRDSAILVAEKVSEVADVAASSAATTDAKLNELASGQQELHTLANSHYTASMQNQLVALRNTSVALTTLADLQEASGKPTFQETRRELADNNKAVKLLESEINDRLLATEQAAKSAGQND